MRRPSRSPASPPQLRELLVDDALDQLAGDLLAVSARATSLCSHCQTCEREISAVAASSIRLKIATAPLPAQPGRRGTAADADVVAQPGLGDARPGSRARRAARAAVTSHVLARAGRAGWAGRRARRRRPRGRAGTRSGCATQEPSKPSPASRVLSAATFSQRGLVDLGVAPARDERRHAADRVRAALVAGAHQQLGVRPHERHRHRHRVAVGQQEVAAPGAELLDDAEHVVPAAGVEARRSARAARTGSPPSRTRPGRSRSAPSRGSCRAGRPKRSCGERRTRRSRAAPRGGSPSWAGRSTAAARGEQRWRCGRSRARSRTATPDVGSPSTRMCFSGRCQPRGRTTIVGRSLVGQRVAPCPRPR